MKTIVVYFSLEGNSKYVADKISKYTGADVLSLDPLKEYPQGKASKYFWGGKSVMTGEKPKLVSYDFKANEYDVIIIGTPIWAGSFAPPIKTFLSENDLSNKKIAIYACHAGGGADKCFDKLKKELPNSEIIARLSLTNPGNRQKKENELKIEEFCNKAKLMNQMNL
jgi:flavodoxin